LTKAGAIAAAWNYSEQNLRISGHHLSRPRATVNRKNPPILWVDGVKLERRYNFPEFGDRRASKVGRVIHFQRTKHRLLCEVLLQATSAHGRGDSEPPEEICGPFRKFGGNLDGDHRSSTPAVFGDT